MYSLYRSKPKIASVNINTKQYVLHNTYSVYINMQLLQQSQKFSAQFIADDFRLIRFYMNTILKGIQSGSATGGMSGDSVALRTVFVIFQLINKNIQSNNLSAVGGLLQQLQFQLQGVSGFFF